MDIHSVLAELAEEHLVSMSTVPWASHAKSIHARAPRRAGETFGCEIDGTYFDVGDHADWQSGPDGDIVLTAFAATEHNGPHRVERSKIIPSD